MEEDRRGEGTYIYIRVHETDVAYLVGPTTTQPLFNRHSSYTPPSEDKNAD